jgi:hypothetical protein
LIFGTIPNFYKIFFGACLFCACGFKKSSRCPLLFLMQAKTPAFRDIRYHRWRTFLLKCVYHDIQQVLGFDI